MECSTPVLHLWVTGQVAENIKFCLEITGVLRWEIAAAEAGFEEIKVEHGRRGAPAPHISFQTLTY
jgi:hypothetical protein